MSARIVPPAVLLSVLGLMLLDCAGQIPPPGGPPDTIPPMIIRTVPDTNTVRVDTTVSYIDLEFSEYVDRRSVEESIFISPYVGELEFDWGGREVRIKFAEPLKTGRTYVVNVGTDVVDLRARNRMASGFTLAFSTGDSIDRGVVSGSVYDDKPEGVMIFAYQLAGFNPEVLDPSSMKPDYIMQTGKDGTFRISNVSYGTYRVLAVRDEYRNYLYDRETDEYGVLPEDVTLSFGQPELHGLQFRLSREDTTGPFLSSVQVLHHRQIVARLSEPIDSATFGGATFEVEDSTNATTLPVQFVYLLRSAPADVGIVLAAPLAEGAEYRLNVRGLYDRTRNPLDTANASYTFTGTALSDTVRPAVEVHVPTTGSRRWGVDDPVELRLSEPVVQEKLEHAIALHDSGGADVRFSLRWTTPVDMTLVPAHRLLSNMKYEVRILLDSLKDLQGNGYADSVFSFKFETLDLRTTGSIEGHVIDESGKGAGKIHLMASQAAARGFEKALVLDDVGKFTFDELPEGKYIVGGFRDTDGSGGYSFGLPYPFVEPERFVVMPDTLKVRARWGVEGVVLRFR